MVSKMVSYISYMVSYTLLFSHSAESGLWQVSQFANRVCVFLCV